MATDDQQILVTGTASTPTHFTISGNGQIRPKSIFTHFDGTAAATPFLPCLKIVSDGGATIGIYPTDESVPAGGSADVTWFPRLKRPCPPPAPSPNPLGTLFAWYDFADTSTITLDGSSNIQLILDKTGNGHDASQNVAANRPAESTLNGLNCGSFTSANGTVLLSGGWSPTLTQPFTIAVVWTQTIASGANYQPGPYGGGPVPNPAILFDNFDNTKLVLQIGGNNVLVPLAAPYTQQQATGTYNGGGSTLRLNGVSTGGAVDADAMTNICLGASHFPSSLTINQLQDGKIGEILIYRGALTAAQLTAVESYLKTKWGTP